MQDTTTPSSTTTSQSAKALLQWAEIRRGFATMVPFWLGAIPFGAAYALSALAAGLSPAQTVAMSLLVFAGASQFTATGLFAAGAAPLAIILTTLIINARHVLLGVSLATYMRQTSGWLRALLAFQLCDESYAVGIRAFLDGKGTPGFQLGCNLSLYTIWPISALIGIALGQFVPDPNAYGLGLIFPLTFIALLMPLLRQRENQIVAGIAALLTIVGALWLPGQWYILLAGIGASVLGAWLVPERSKIHAASE